MIAVTIKSALGTVVVVAVALLALLALLPATIARNKGQDPGMWWLYGFLLWPVAFIHSLHIKPTEADLRRVLAEQGYMSCPYCDEMIRPQAIVCRYCGRDLVQALQSSGRSYSVEDARHDYNLTPPVIPLPTATPVPPPPGTPAGWLSDPVGKYEHRYWDGSEWTEHVAAAGQQMTSALAEPPPGRLRHWLQGGSAWPEGRRNDAVRSVWTTGRAPSSPSR